MTKEEGSPYSMCQALELLHDELSAELDKHTQHRTWRQHVRDWAAVLHHSRVKSLYHWTTALIATLLAAALLVAFGFSENIGRSESIWTVVQACVILILVACNLYLAIHSVNHEQTEFTQLLRDILKQLSTCMRYNMWNKSYFPRIEAPASPCFSLQWTVRDGQVYNMPTPLLVTGDVILLRPGHVAPACCVQIQENGGSSEMTELREGEVYAPPVCPEQASQTFTHPQGRQPLNMTRFRLTQTPYINALRQLLRDRERPASIIEHEKFLILSHWIERRTLPAVLALMLVVNILRFTYMKGHVGYWTDMVLTLQVQAVFPLIPLLLPGMYCLINFYGQARVFAAFEAAKSSKSLGDDSFDTDSSISADEARLDLPWKHVLDWFWNIVLGRVHVVTRKVNITHILGSVTSLCCVDKKGILSYPNPTPEKIFFLRHGQKDLVHQSSVVSSDGPPATTQDTEHVDAFVTTTKFSETAQSSSTWVEVLDVTSDPKNSFSIQFDDPGWQQHISSLKPLGLTILANTCNLDTANWYTQFTDHVACAGLQNEETVAVVNRRCLCPLAKEIGFSEKALDIFSVENTLGMYRQVSAEMTTKERLQRAKSFIQHKIPMPNLVSVILREKVSGSCQLLSQGTADILLSCCSDYWDGHDLNTLTQSERKKILDFYHRTSIGSYCTAFSYCPVRPGYMGSRDNLYIELPDDQHCGRMSTSISSVDGDLELLSEVGGGADIPRSFSADSLMDAGSIVSEDDQGGTLQAQCNQVFIGMVTMQYQARQDFIQLIDKLEGACIRFVHFSQENEVRSRVFAEKMGLEAGWNCHVSLRSEKQYLSSTSANVTGPDASQVDLTARISTRYSSRHSTVSYSHKPVLARLARKLHRAPSKSLSHSAPSVVNLGSSQVKFEPRVKTAIVSPRRLKRSSVDGPAVEGEEVLLLQGEDDVAGHHGGVAIEMVELGDSHLELDGGVGCWGSDEELSRQASSYITENTEDSLAFDNRAKLPRGIENIRPHLRSIDNVPLLVNLFTDCTTDTTCEMMQIMQEHGEVVLCVGSSTNMQNIPLFLQANCSVALEPYFPAVCVQQPAASLLWDKDVPTPLQLASSLISLMCPILINKDGNISLIHLIAEARCHLMSMRNCFYFMLCCSLSVTIAQVLASLLQLPCILPAQHVLWLTLVVVPLLGITLMGNPVDARVMTLATAKNDNHLSTETTVRFIVYYLMRFLPPILAALVCFSLTLKSYCATQLENPCSIFDVLDTPPDYSRTWSDKFSGGLVLAQNIFIFLLVLYFEVISLSFVHWTDHLWQQFPATNRLWLTVIPLLLLSQVVFCVCDTYVRSGEVQYSLAVSNLHPAVWAVGLAFPIVMVVVNELVKHREIKLAVRSQKRARLDFGTKLGMNSPF